MFCVASLDVVYARSKRVGYSTLEVLLSTLRVLRVITVSDAGLVSRRVVCVVGICGGMKPIYVFIELVGGFSHMDGYVDGVSYVPILNHMSVGTGVVSDMVSSGHGRVHGG